MYVMGGVYSILLGNILIPFGDGKISIHRYIYAELLQPLLGDYPASLAYALLFVSFVWATGYVLYKKQIYIKI
jgi:predicted acyltransferase